MLAVRLAGVLAVVTYCRSTVPHKWHLFDKSEETQGLQQAQCVLDTGSTCVNAHTHTHVPPLCFVKMGIKGPFQRLHLFFLVSHKTNPTAGSHSANPRHIITAMPSTFCA
jgi:hypothetical protein